jgi:hypothetical protein
MGTFIILLIVLGIIYILFLKKGSEQKTFYKYTKDTYDSVEKRGGMTKIYDDLVELYKDSGFSIKKVTKTSIHMISRESNVGVQEFDIVQTGPNKANFIFESKLENGKSRSISIERNYFENDTDPIEILSDIDLEYLIVSDEPSGYFAGYPYVYLKEKDGKITINHVYTSYHHDGKNYTQRTITYNNDGKIIDRKSITKKK